MEIPSLKPKPKLSELLFTNDEQACLWSGNAGDNASSMTALQTLIATGAQQASEPDFTLYAVDELTALSMNDENSSSVSRNGVLEALIMTRTESTSICRGNSNLQGILKKSNSPAAISPCFLSWQVLVSMTLRTFTLLVRGDKRATAKIVRFNPLVAVFELDEAADCHRDWYTTTELDRFRMESLWLDPVANVMQRRPTQKRLLRRLPAFHDAPTLGKTPANDEQQLRHLVASLAFCC